MNKDIKLIVGLGNPTKKYALTRHNIGFMMADCYANANKFKNGTIKGNDIRIKYTDSSVILLKPQDYMNNSGISVRAVKEQLEIENKNILVIHDEMDLDFGIMRVKAQTKNTQHNGIKSIAQNIGNDFARLRFGIGRSKYQTGYDYVLSPFANGERKCMCELSITVINIIDCFVEHGVQQAMQQFNSGVKNGL
ncbi:MAG: aminoacyl-tRNA hydrolase [Patescibacteria group bacterium]